MPSFRRLPFISILAVTLLPGAQALAQGDDARPPAHLTEGVITVSGDSVDRLRLAQLDGVAPPDGLMLRSTSSLSDPRRYGMAPRPYTIVFPYLNFVTNSSLPFGQNDGALWAGVGANARVMAGFTGTFGPVRIVAIPELVYSANNRLPLNPTDTLFAPKIPASRSPFSSPFNIYPYSIDLPYRFGASSVTHIYPGQSSITVTAGPVEVGAATENEWWGPAIRNPLVLGDNAPGFPHGFIRTTGGLNGPLGNFDARYIVGGLHESDFFDNDITNDVRSISAFALAWRPARESQFTLGLTRAVIAPATGYSDVPAAFFNALKNVGHPDARSIKDSTFIPGADQLLSVFGRWAIPHYGLETYVEWVRADLPNSVRDFFEEPNNSRGYTAGLQWTRANASRTSRFRFQGEITSVEQATTYRFRPVGSIYTSRSVPQGFTNEGQVLGAGIGPGSSGGFAAADYFHDGWQFGLTLGRTRFNNDAFFLQSYASRCGHDVTFYPGARGSFSNRYTRISVDVSHDSRYNTFFQNKSLDCTANASDHTNNQLSVTVATFGW
jgi:hypothetical protein